MATKTGHTIGRVFSEEILREIFDVLAGCDNAPGSLTWREWELVTEMTSDDLRHCCSVEFPDVLEEIDDIECDNLDDLNRILIRAADDLWEIDIWEYVNEKRADMAALLLHQYGDEARRNGSDRHLLSRENWDRGAAILEEYGIDCDCCGRRGLGDCENPPSLTD